MPDNATKPPPLPKPVILTCGSCGKEFSSGITECPEDGDPLIDFNIFLTDDTREAEYKRRCAEKVQKRKEKILSSIKPRTCTCGQPMLPVETRSDFLYRLLLIPAAGVFIWFLKVPPVVVHQCIRCDARVKIIGRGAGVSLAFSAFLLGVGAFVTAFSWEETFKFKGWTWFLAVFVCLFAWNGYALIKNVLTMIRYAKWKNQR